MALSSPSRPRFPEHLSIACLFCVFVWGNSAASPPGSPSKNPGDRHLQGPEGFFEKKIRPVLVEHCHECHSSEARRLKAGLRLDTHEGLWRGGDSGPVIVPGKPDESLLIRALSYDDADLEMPPEGKLPDSVIADFERWVASGAPDSLAGGGKAVSTPSGDATTVARRNWAFDPPRAVEPPAVRDTSWPRGEIDRFVLARLERSGLTPAPDADRRALIRRLYFDLLGLPPSPAEVESFFRDDSPHALERLVDRLLDSPHFGERWGRHWLDVARYADSTGGGRTKALENAWRYRDWVIRSFNRDKPFDRFIREQIAGDLLPWETVEERRENLIATGFLILGPHNYENQDKELLRMDVVDEQIDTTGRTFLAMTLGCARCHDHKFDPIPSRDYYALAGIFRSTKSLTPGNVSGFVERPLPVEGELAARLEEHERAVSEVAARLADVKKMIAKLRPQDGKKRKASLKPGELPGVVVDDADAERVGSWKASTFTAPFVGKGYLHDENAGKGDKRVTFRPEIPRSGLYEVRFAYTPGTNRDAAAPVTVRHAGGEKTVHVDQRRRPPIEGVFIPVGRFRFEQGGTAEVTVSNAGTRAHVIADAAQFIPVEALEAKKPPARPPADPVSVETRDRKVRLARAESERKRLEKELQKLRREGPKRPMTMSVEEEEVAEDWHLHIRGQIRNLGERVPRGFLRAVAPTPSAPAIGEGQSGRLQLAEWIAAPANPLTARVVVNRVWHWLLGAGLVRTVDNFGSRGERPSHPELLDWLARRFVARGWSMKEVIREIVLSRTYGLSSRPDPRAAEIDPENRLLSHANRKRLDAEAIRDAALSVAGELDLTAGGPSIIASAGKKAGNKIEYGYRYTTKRRSVYVPIFRNALYELFEVFDFADPNVVAGRRADTTRATQALYLLNSPFIMEQSRRAAERLLAEEGLDDGKRVELAYERILGRPPGERERVLALEFLARQNIGDAGGPDASAAERRLTVWAGWIQALFSCVDFRFLE